MSFSDGISKGRSHIIFMCGLIAASGIIIGLEQSSLLNAHPPAVTAAARLEAATLAWQAAAGDPEAARLANSLGVDTRKPVSAGTRTMSPAAGRAILQALSQPALSKSARSEAAATTP